MHPSAQKVAAAARDLGLTIEVFEHEQTTRSAADAAAAIGCTVGQIVKSLCFVVGDTAVLTLVSGSNQLDLKKLAHALGTSPKKVRRADADTARAATGFAIGGVPPFGHVTSLPVYIDQDLLDYEVVWAAAGTPNAVFAVGPAALVAATGGLVTDLRQEPL